MCLDACFITGNYVLRGGTLCRGHYEERWPDCTVQFYGRMDPKQCAVMAELGMAIANASDHMI